MMSKLILGLGVILLLICCKQADLGPLPIIGDRPDLNGEMIDHKIRPFSFVDQLGDTITNAKLADKIHLVDFFFTSCPSICPKVTKQMLRIYDYTEKYDDVILVSHTLDPKRDTEEVLKLYADNLDIDHDRWLFLRGGQEEIMEIANEDYFIAALEAPNAPGGFDHSGKIILLDKNAKIRGFCEGTESESVDKMMKTIDRLRKEYE